MSDIYVYDSRCEDFANFGLVGALTPSSCIFEETANGMSEITLVHPIDALGRYTALICHNILVVEVPVRTTPEIADGAIVTSVESWKVRSKSSITKAQRTLYKKRTGSTKIKVLSGGTAVTVVQKADERYKVKTRYGTGWIDPDGIEYIVKQTIADNSQSIESVQPAWTVKPQMFRIYDVEKGMDAVTASARHISYDLLYNITSYSTSGSVKCSTALAGIMNGCVSAHDFDAYTNMADVRTGIGWKHVNPISALLDPENGLTTLYGAALVRDNWELYILKDPGLNRGVTVEYGKNMTGLSYTENYESIATRIIPLGETKDGNTLMLSGSTPWVNSSRINDYPTVYTQTLKCTDCKVGTDGVTTAIARARMQEQARAVFDAGGDLPSVELSVDFINLGDTAEYPQYKDLERCFLWDYVIVRHKLHRIDVTARIVSIRWDCLTERMDGMEIGSVGKTLANTGITTWQIPTGFSGNKIAGGTIGGAALQPDIISERHVQADSINAGAIQANSVTAVKIAAGAIETDKLAANAVTADKIDAGAVTAEKIAAGAVTADKIDTEMLEAEIIEAVNGVFDNVSIDGELYANFAKILELAADSIVAGNIEADRLAAALAEIISLHAKTGDFDLATVENLLANALILKQGQAGSMQITNLAVTSANLLNATIGELVLKGSDGLYYRVYIGSDGVIHTEEVTVSDGEISAGQTAQGRHIVDTSANIKDLNTQTITGQSAIIDTIVTTALTAGKITASEALIASATIPTLYTTAITAIGQSLDLSAVESIKLMVARKTATYYTTIEPNAEEAAPGDLWINPAEGRTYIAGGLTGRNEPEFDVSDGVHLMYRYGEDADDIVLLIDDNGNLVSPVGGVTIDENGVLSATNVWMPVIPSELHTSYIDIMQDQILINTGGHIRIGAGGTFDVEAGAAHFKTADYTLSILAEDGSEDTVLDFDTESKTLKVDEIRATNVRPYIPGITEVTAAEIGGIDGLANMLNQARYEHLVYTQTYDDTSSEPIIINGCEAIMVEIKSGELRTQIPPLRISNTRSNIWIEGIEWNCAGTDAITADSGEICIKNCIATAQNGVVASRHARVAWIGAEAGSLESAGTCAADAFIATDGADIKIYGMIPSGTLKQTTAGAITAIDTNIGSIVTAKPVEKTVTLTASIGNYSDKQYWGSGLYQGYTNGRGKIYGCMKFTLPADVESITAATLTLAAENGVGTGSKVNVVVYGSATAYQSRPSLGTKYISKTSAVYGGTSCSLDATSAATALLNGSAKQLVLYVGDTAVISGKVYSKNYAKFSSAKLKITYQGRSST